MALRTVATVVFGVFCVLIWAFEANSILLLIGLSFLATLVAHWIVEFVGSYALTRRSSEPTLEEVLRTPTREQIIAEQMRAHQEELAAWQDELDILYPAHPLDHKEVWVREARRGLEQQAELGRWLKEHAEAERIHPGRITRQWHQYRNQGAGVHEANDKLWFWAVDHGCQEEVKEWLAHMN